MIKVNDNYSKLAASYLFSDIASKVSDFQKSNPDKDIIKLGIGDVTRALPDACTEAMHKAVDEMSNDATFRGYGPEQGHEFLRTAIAENDYQARNCDISADDIFVSDGAKCDTANIQELFSQDITVAVPDPVYPVYVDTNVMAGRTGQHENGRYTGLVYLECTSENNYVPAPPDQAVDLIYLCFPNNPTGATATKEQLKEWVDYAKDSKALIIFDAAYEAFIKDDSIPKSIYEIEGAKEVAIESRSFSKTAGFTGTRCAFTVVPEECRAFNSNGESQPLQAMWNRRHCTKFNGVSYPVQRAAEASYSEAGKAQVQELIDYYLNNAQLIRTSMLELGFHLVGGENSPYVWIRSDKDSWEFFDLLLNKAGVVITPGSGFGSCGNGYIRISAFNSINNVKEALARITKTIHK